MYPQQKAARPLKVTIPGYNELTFQQQQLVSDILWEGFRTELEYLIWAHKVIANSVTEKEAPGLKILTKDLLLHAIVGWPDGPKKQEVKMRVASYLVRKAFRREHGDEIQALEASPVEALQGVRNE